MLVRRAKREEFKIIANHLMLAMDDIIYRFIGEQSAEKANQLLENLIKQKGNQYSYENCWVAETEKEIVASALVYDGAKLYELRKPVIAEIKSMFKRDFSAENETQAGEYYIDCIAVSPNQQGKGIGSKLLLFLINEYVHKQHKILGLLVDKENPHAKKLYLKLGFQLAGERRFSDKDMEHLQFKPTIAVG